MVNAKNPRIASLRLEFERNQENMRRVQREEDAKMNHLFATKMTPYVPHAHHTDATDWIDDLSTLGKSDGQIHQLAKAEATDWFKRVASFVKEEKDEFAVQRDGYARVWSSQFGFEAELAKSAFIDQVNHLSWAESHVDEVLASRKTSAPIGKRKHLLLTQDIKNKLPSLYAQDGKGDNAIAYVKFFSPISDWTWYATEFDGEDTFFGLVVGHFPELGYFSLGELESLEVNGMPAVERDMYWSPMTIGEIKKEHGL